MKRMIVCLGAYLILTVSFKPVDAVETNIANNTEATASVEAKVMNHISTVYQEIDFTSGTTLSQEAFTRAYYGYLNLRNSGKLNVDKHILTVCDFSLPSTEKRMWVIDLATRQVLFNTYVAHGKGSGDTYATVFSNKEESHKSSLGFYVTGSTYQGKHGNSLRLNGMDEGFNDAALDRAVVVHGSKYVGDNYVAQNNSLGRSWGCPAVSDKLAQPIIKNIKDGTCLFIYYPEKSYLNATPWLNKKIQSLPEDAFADVSAMQKQIKVEFSHNGKVDSVRYQPLANK